MITNKIIDIILVILSFVVIPVQIVTTFVLGLLVSLPLVGFLLLLPISAIWIVLFLGPLLGLSYVYEKAPILRPAVAIIGIPWAVVADIYVALIPSMGEMNSRYIKMLYCQTFPYSWSFDQFFKNRANLNQHLETILGSISKGNVVLSNFINQLSTKTENWE